MFRFFNIIKIFKRIILGADDAKGINTEAKIRPQNIKKRFRLLSAKNPNTGCNIFEQIWVIAINTVAIAIENPNLAAIKGIIGLRKPP